MGGFANIARTAGGVGNDVFNAQQNLADIQQRAAAAKLADIQARLSINEQQQTLPLKLQQLRQQVDPSAQLAMLEKALGRSLTPQEKQTVLGLPTLAKYTDVKTDAQGRQYGISSLTGRYELIPTDEAVQPIAPKQVAPKVLSSENIPYGVQRVGSDGQVHIFQPGDPEWTAEDAKLIQGMTEAGAAGEERKIGGQVKAAKEKANLPSVLSDDALNAVTDVFLKTGNLPALGIGSATIREAIFNRAGAILAGKHPAPTIGDPLVASRAAFTALQGSLTQLQRQRASVGAFEGTALKNLELFEDRAKPIIDSGSPWVNTPLRAVATQGFGSSDLAAYNAARQVALTEISRVISNPNMTGVLSDEARGQVSSLIGPNATLAQLYAATGVLKQDMENRKDSLDEEIKSVSDQVRRGAIGPPSAPSGAGAPPPGSHVLELDDFLKGK